MRRLCDRFRLTANSYWLIARSSRRNATIDRQMPMTTDVRLIAICAEAETRSLARRHLSSTASKVMMAQCHTDRRTGGPVARSAVFRNACFLRYFLDVSPPGTAPDDPDVPPLAPPSALLRAVTRPVTGASRLVVPAAPEPPEACSAPVDDDATDVAGASGLLALPVAPFSADPAGDDRGEDRDTARI